jgi:hypothetical protein
MHPIITTEDLVLINDLTSREYANNTMLSNATESEKALLLQMRSKLKSLASIFEGKLRSEYGIMEVASSSGNPIKLGSKGTRLNRVWAGFFKGASNKQYSAQISFVIDPLWPCLNVGFYFGRASAHSLDRETRLDMEKRLESLGDSLSTAVQSDKVLLEKYEDLFDFGFQAIVSENRVNGSEWLNSVSSNPKDCQIVYQLYPNENGYIELTTIDLYVNMIVFLMSLIPQEGSRSIKKSDKPLTPEQRARQAERRALIGEKGELFVMGAEKDKLEDIGLDPRACLRHVALESMSYGYDILSRDARDNEIHIEVKTTTRLKSDPKSKSFHLSAKEHGYYLKNKTAYRLYRVYDIEGKSPEFVSINMKTVTFSTETYLATIDSPN